MKLDKKIETKARNNFLDKEQYLSPYATKSSDAIRLNEQQEDIRTPFFRDSDRILHSLSYSRYANKTQVFSFKENDHISMRMTHVQLVSKIARTIGRALRLNEDLIEAIGLGHDIGHTPLGHAGEAMLNEISRKELGEYFAHNIQGVRQFMNVDNDGEGHNLTMQVLDGIMCHNGEILDPIYKPMEKDKEEFLREYIESYIHLEKNKKYAPMTLEGCVVRISDVIAYIGRDIEDAINLGYLKRSKVPKNIRKVLGDNNKDIVNNIVLDIINESMDKPYIKMSDDVFKALFDLKKFNYENIYSKSMDSEEYNYYKDGMRKLYDMYLHDIETKNTDSVIYKVFLNSQNDYYLDNTDPKRQVIDFIAGMTDEFFLNQVRNYCKEDCKIS